MEEVKQQVVKLEWRVDKHDEELRILRDSETELKIQLNNISKSLLQIKWFILGGGIVLLADTLGLSEVIRLIGV